MSIFEAVRQAVSTREAAERYGIQVHPSGKALCPFHDDRHPSMRLYEDHYHCFACGAHGDSVALAAGLFGLTPMEAARKLAADFSLSEESFRAFPVKRKNPAQQQREEEQRCVALMGRYYRLLKRWMEEEAPSSPAEPPGQRFLEACNELGTTEYALDRLLAGDADLVRGLMADGKMDRLEQRLRKLDPHHEDKGGTL